MAFSPRVDPIVTDLCKGIETAAGAGIQDSMVEALLVRRLCLCSGAQCVP
jgi:hypothetical protein